MKRHFIIAGAQRSGTTYLHHLFDMHPEICMAKPLRPEPKFFIKYSEVSKITLKQYYDTCFQHCVNESVLGEKSTSYIEHPKVLKNIKLFFGEVKVFVIIRNPVHRAISNYLYSRQNLLETRSIEEVFVHQLPPPHFTYNASVNPFHYLERGVYLGYIRTLNNIFGKQNVKIIIHEQLISNKSEIAKLYLWLGVNHNFLPDLYLKKIHSSHNDIPVDTYTKIVQILQKYYNDSNSELENYLGYQIPEWHPKQN